MKTLALLSLHLIGSLLFLLMGGDDLSAQSVVDHNSVRMWGFYTFDTESRRLRAVDIDADTEYANAAILRSDGRCFVQGQGPHNLGAVPQGEIFTDVEVGTSIGLGLRPDGTIVGWGNWYHQLLHPVPPLPAGLRYVGMSAGYHHALLLRSDGVAVGAGVNWYNQLAIPVLPPGVTVVQIKARVDHSMLLLSNGTAIAFGDNTWGQCNVPSAGAGLVYTDISCGQTHMLARRSDGSLAAWGSNLYGEGAVPAFPAGATVVRCAAGSAFNVVYLSNGMLMTWGRDTATFLAAPSPPPGLQCEQLDAGTLWAMARWSDGSVTTWGDNLTYCGYLPSSERSRNHPRLADRFTRLSVGSYHTLIQRADGTAEGFGANPDGRCDIPPLPSGMQYRKFVAHQNGSLALRSDGRIVTFGSNPGNMWTAPQLPAGVTYTDVVGKVGHFVALRSDGTARAFGSNQLGQCNLPSLPPGTSYTAASAHYLVTLLLRSDGVIVHAGDGAYWQQLIPSCPAGIVYTSVAVGTGGAAAIRSDGTAASWATTPYVPPLPWGVYYVQVSAGDALLWLRRSDGQVVTGGTATILLNGPHYQPPPLDPGTSYLDIDSAVQQVAARVGPTTIYVGRTPGCTGSRPAARLVPNDTPRIGRSLSVRLFDLPVNVALMAMGWQSVVPIDLGYLGMPGCNLGISVDAVAGVVGTGYQAVWTLPIPDQPSLVGMHFHNQALVLDPLAGNSLGAVLSDAMEGVVGYP